MVRCCPPVLHLRPSMLIDQFGHVECHHLLPPLTRPRVPLTPFLCECQSLAGRWLFKPCQIRRMMISNMPATLETHLTVAHPACTGSMFPFYSHPCSHSPCGPAPQPHQHILHKVRSCTAAASTIVFFSLSMFAHKTPRFLPFVLRTPPCSSLSRSSFSPLSSLMASHVSGGHQE